MILKGEEIISTITLFPPKIQYNACVLNFELDCQFVFQKNCINLDTTLVESLQQLSCWLGAVIYVLVLLSFFLAYI